MAAKLDTNTVELRALDPDTGAVTATQSFSSLDATLALDNQDPGNVWRQAFNPSLTAVAATGPEEADGSQGAGAVSVDGYEQLTAESAGYGTVLQKQVIGFNPATGDLWYQTPQGSGSSTGLFGHVTPSAGSSSDTVVDGKQPFQNGMIGGYNNRVYFAPDGTPQSIGGVQSTVYLPGGTEVERDPVNWGFQIGQYGQVTVDSPSTPVVPDGAEIGWMGLPVSNNSFLTKSDTQLFLNTIGSNAVTVQPLLPESNHSIGEMVISPDGEMVAFVSTTGELTELWMTSLSGESQPVQLTSFVPDLGHAYALIAWQ